jgi:hypothetical protein
MISPIIEHKNTFITKYLSIIHNIFSYRRYSIIDENLSGIKNHRKLLWTIYYIANWWSEVKMIDKKIDNRDMHDYKKFV